MRRGVHQHTVKHTTEAICVKSSQARHPPNLGVLTCEQLCENSAGFKFNIQVGHTCTWSQDESDLFGSLLPYGDDIRWHVKIVILYDRSIKKHCRLWMSVNHIPVYINEQCVQVYSIHKKWFTLREGPACCGVLQTSWECWVENYFLLRNIIA